MSDFASGLERIRKACPDYLLHGHSHIAADQAAGATRRICPGPLSRADTLSVALLDTDSEEVRFLRLPDEPAE